MNSQTFTPEEVKIGLHLDLIRHLLKMNEQSDTHYNEIKVWTDGYCTIVDWVQRNYNDDYCDDRFELLQSDELIMKEVEFPDGHYDYFTRESADKALDEWLIEHPSWKRTQYGQWYNEEEEKYIKEQLLTQENKPQQLSLEDFGIKTE